MKKNNKGFSLVELIVVIAIMAILAAVAVVSYSVYIDRAHEASDWDYISNVLYAVKLFSTEHGVEVQKVVISNKVDGPDDIQLIIGEDEQGNPIYYTDGEGKPSKSEIYDIVGDYTMYGDGYTSEDLDVEFDPTIPPSVEEGGEGQTHTHNPTEVVDSQPSTCQQQGYIKKRCSIGDCDYTVTVNLALGDHREPDNVNEIKEKDGCKAWICPDCGKIIIKSTSGNAVVPIMPNN
jgi:prepilin-type N-terminal cleavage/methylation domain-containing protein